MIFVQNLLCLFQIDGRRCGRFPGQAGDEIQIVVEHAVFVAFLPLLAHPVQNLFRFLFCGFIHAGPRDFSFEFPDVGNVFRVHIVQLFLQVIDLLFEGRFPVKLLLVPFLGGFRLLGNPGNFHEFADGPDNFLISFFAGIRRQDFIFFPGGQVQIV